MNDAVDGRDLTVSTNPGDVFDPHVLLETVTVYVAVEDGEELCVGLVDPDNNDPFFRH